MDDPYGIYGCRLLDTLYAVTVALELGDDRIGTGQVARADRDHDGSGLAHALLDPLAPVCVARVEESVGELRRIGEIAVERPRNTANVALGPCSRSSLSRRLYSPS